MPARSGRWRSASNRLERPTPCGRALPMAAPCRGHAVSSSMRPGWAADASHSMTVFPPRASFVRLPTPSAEDSDVEGAPLLTSALRRRAFISFSRRLTAISSFRLCLCSPAPQRWQNVQAVPLLHPDSFHRNTHGLHFLRACPAEPTVGISGLPSWGCCTWGGCGCARGCRCGRCWLRFRCCGDGRMAGSLTVPCEGAVKPGDATDLLTLHMAMLPGADITRRSCKPTSSIGRVSSWNSRNVFFTHETTSTWKPPSIDSDSVSSLSLADDVLAHVDASDSWVNDRHSSDSCKVPCP
mmetsp:Transcript_123237/g.349209  ORF Transcript_123237/g.349209 Transcript_123237/m.349209 type:complete len:296 (-) Transcript_123237:178-1065(-)